MTAFVQLDGTACRGTLATHRSAQMLAHLQIRQTFDFRDAAREDVFLALLLNGQQALFEAYGARTAHQIAQVMPGCIFAFEAHPLTIPAYPAASSVAAAMPPAIPPGRDADGKWYRVAAGPHGVPRVRFSQSDVPSPGRRETPRFIRSPAACGAWSRQPASIGCGVTEPTA